MSNIIIMSRSFLFLKMCFSLLVGQRPVLLVLNIFKTNHNLVLFQSDIVKELNKARLEIDNVKRQMLQQEIAFNIQQTDALTRYAS